MPAQRILVAGGSGIIAGHCILELLAQGHRVSATMRSLEKEARVNPAQDAILDAGRSMIAKGLVSS